MEWFDKNAAAIIAASAALIASLIAGTFALLGAYLNHWFSNKRYEEQKLHDAAKDNKRLYLEKGEELHSLITQWGNTAYADMMGGRNVIAGIFTKVQHRDFVKENFDPAIYMRLKSLMDIYFNDLWEHFNKVREIPTNAPDITEAYERGSLSQIDALNKHDFYCKDFDHLLAAVQEELQKILLEQLKN